MGNSGLTMGMPPLGRRRRLQSELTPKNGRKPLHTATMNGDERKVLKLLVRQADVDVDDVVDRDGYTPLHYAVIYGHPNLIRILLQHGADVNKAGNNSLRPCHLILISKNKMACLEELLEYNPDLEAREIYGNTILQAMVMTFPYEIDVIRKLLDQGSNPNNVNAEGNNCLHSTAFADFFVSVYKIGALVKALVQKGFDVNAKNLSGDTPLHFAVRQNESIVKDLLKYGADINAVNNQQVSVFERAMAHDNEYVMEALIRYIVLRVHSGLHVDESTILHIAANEKYRKIRSKYEDEMDLLKTITFEENSEFTYYNVLCSRRVRRNLMKNFMVFTNLCFASMRHISFKYEICLRLSEALDFRSNEKAAFRILTALWGDVLPDLCIEHIISYLDLDDLKQLRSAFYELSKLR